MRLDAKTTDGEDVQIVHRDLGEVGNNVVSQFCICKFITSIVPKELGTALRLKNDAAILIAAGIDIDSIVTENGHHIFRETT